MSKRMPTTAELAAPLVLRGFLVLRGPVLVLWRHLMFVGTPVSIFNPIRITVGLAIIYARAEKPAAPVNVLVPWAKPVAGFAPIPAVSSLSNWRLVIPTPAL